MSWWFGSESQEPLQPLSLVVRDMAGREYPMTMDQNNTILDIKRKILRQNKEYVIPIQKLVYTPLKGAPIPNDIPYHPAYNDNTYNKENPYYILSDKQKLSFWNFPQDVILELIIDSTDYIPVNIELKIAIKFTEEYTFPSPMEIIFLMEVRPGDTFTEMFTTIHRIYQREGKPYAFSLFRRKRRALNIQRGELFYQEIQPSDIIDESYREHPYVYLYDNYIMEKLPIIYKNINERVKVLRKMVHNYFATKTGGRTRRTRRRSNTLRKKRR